MRISAVVLAVLLAGCNQATSLLLRISGPATLTSLDISAVLASGGSAQGTLDVTGKPSPGTAVIVLPDLATQVNLSVTGHTSDGSTLHAAAIVNSTPHQQLTVPIQLGPPLTDGGQPIDMAGAPGDLATTFQPRLIGNAYYSDYSGATFKFPAGMSHSGFAIDTTGIVNGDLVFFIGSVDNGSNNLWPNPIAPGFTQIGQAFYGNDGQTFVVQYKVADNEPAQYTGNYGPGVGSSSATITLIAVSGVASNPINNYLVSFDTGPGITPVVGSSVGITTNVPGCAILYMSGTDWLGQTGSNTFMPPAGYTPLAQIGDRGANMWDWTSQQVAYTIQPAAGPTGTISGSMTGTYSGTAWTVVVAVAPR